MRLRHGVAAVLLLVFPLQAFGWLDIGHMAVAYVAYQHLTPQTRARANALIKLNPYYQSKWLPRVPAGTSVADRDMMVFMIAATWADEIKAADSGYTDDPGSTSPHRPGPDPDVSMRNIGYQDHLRHRYWHFINRPFSTDGTGLPSVPVPNAQTEIDLLRSSLGPANNDIKSYDLVWLLHLVGDVHQPLHAITRVSSQDGRGDDGGNKVIVCTSADACSSRLHTFWDGLPGSGDSLGGAIEYAKSLASPDPIAAVKLDTATWISESWQLAQSDVYVSPVLSGDGPFTITSSYSNHAKNMAKQRVALAGVRLANVLNMELK